MNFFLDELIGYKIEAEDGSIGSVHDILFDDEAWVVRYVVVDTGGWLLGRKVLLAPSSLYEPDESRQVLQVKLTKDQVKDSPETPVDPPFSREQEALYRDHYQLPYYWADVNALDRNAMASIAPEATALGTSAPGPAMEPPIPVATNDPMLRSARTVKGHTVRSGGEEIGDIADYVIDCTDWVIPHIVVKLKDGDVDRILVPTTSVVRAGWDDKVIDVTFGPDLLRSAPRFDETVKRDKRFMEGVADHYERNVSV